MKNTFIKSISATALFPLAVGANTNAAPSNAHTPATRTEVRRVSAIAVALAGVAALMILLLGPAVSIAQESGRPDGMRFVPDVHNQFYNLTIFADAMGFRIGNSPDPSKCRHYQGLARVDAADGTPYLLITRSGNQPTDFLASVPCTTNEFPGNLLIVRMGSRDKNGERLRSNRLRKDQEVSDTPPPPEDIVVNYLTFDGADFNGEETGGVLKYGHPGGMQVVGHILAMAIEHRYDPSLPKAGVVFWDVTNPESPQFRSMFSTDAEMGDIGTGVVGVTPLPNGLYLMVVTGGPKNETYYFYRSTTNDFASTNWVFVGTTPGPDVCGFLFCNPHQCLNFLRQGDIDGLPLYLAGARGNIIFGEDRIDLYRVTSDTPNFAPGEQIHLGTEFHGRLIEPHPNLGGDVLVSLAAGSGFYVSPSGELIFYATEHDNDGPSDGTNGTVKMGEWRHKDVVRQGSPTLLPTAHVDGPFEVDEGSAANLTGTAAPPLTKAWIQPFGETNLDEVAGTYTIVDFDDYGRDNFDNFSKLGGNLFTDHIRSWNWFAPVGCSIMAIDHVDGEIDETKTLVGTNNVERDLDLRLVQNDGGGDDVNDEIDAVAFLDDCYQYYSTPFLLQWDLDRDGSYDTTSNSVSFSAASLDGPSEISIPVQAVSPLGGPAGQTVATVIVRNVPPQLTYFRITDAAGHQVNVEVPFLLTKAPVIVAATFIDPGTLDHQSAMLDWGDGSLEPQSAFSTFDEAFGDGTGALSHTHRYLVPGLYTIALSVRDDDDGVGSQAAAVRVLSPEQAVQEIIAMIDSAIAGTADNKVRASLNLARRALAGSTSQSSNGALSMIKAGNNAAAIAFLQDAIFWLQNAQAQGANLATEIALLEQLIAARSAD